MQTLNRAELNRTCHLAVITGFALSYALSPAWAAADSTISTDSLANIPASVPHITVPAYVDQSVIGGNVMTGASGAMAVNQAAGDMNQQANAAAIAYNPQGTATAQTGILQGSLNLRGSLPTMAETRIDGNAFSRTSGVLMVNQASGFANSQANSTAIAMGIKGEVIADTVLAEASPNAAGLVNAGKNQVSIRNVSVSETAFKNTTGVVQLNQTAGSGNNSANNFALRLAAEPKL